MKKFVSLLLCISMLFSFASLTAFAKEESVDLSIAVASDLHYVEPREEIEGVIEDELYFYANRRAAMEDESGFIIDAFLKDCAEDDSVQYVLIPGDIVNDGRIILQQHIDAAAKLRAFEKATGKPVFVIPGNHDYGAGENDIKFDDFKELYADFGYDKALTVEENNCSYTANLGDKYRLIALDSNDPTKSTEDGMNAQKMDWVRRQAKQAEKDGRYPVLMMHHNLLDHLPVQRLLSRNFIVKFHYSTADLFANWGIKAVFTGHEHCGDVSVYTSTLGNKIYDFANTALTMYPIEFRKISFTDEEITYKTETIRKIDTDALTSVVGGYTDEHIRLMNEDFNSYALGFLKAGVKYRLLRSLKMEQMGIEESNPFYNLVNTAVTGLKDILEMPLYGENSVSELAAEYNIELPASNYKNGWDLATHLVSEHYAGGEKYPLTSVEVTMLLRIVNLILKDVLSTVNDEVFIKAANELIAKNDADGITKSIVKTLSNTFGAVKPGTYFLVALVSPLLYEFAYDSDEVDDRNGVIEGYNSSDYNPMDNVIAKISDFFATLSLYFSFFIEIVAKIFKF
ncbi:MAG: metallophosphoesterase [Clostridia bacterium]|nr:metallophosphoesterase [Clostridia bacterium]